VPVTIKEMRARKPSPWSLFEFTDTAVKLAYMIGKSESMNPEGCSI